MYYCSDCGKEFGYAKVCFGTTPKGSERVLLCPFCEGLNFREKRDDYCSYCGRKVAAVGKRYCCDSCKNMGERLFAKEKETDDYKKRSPLYKAVTEVDNYNRLHNCALSYGQYYALKGANMI